MSDDRESGYEAAARIRARDLRYTSPHCGGGGQTRLTGLFGERASERGGEQASSASQNICVRRFRKELW